mgnify:CR=1 FL=1
MFWADRLVEEARGQFGEKIRSGTPLIIRDEKTASGRVHVGSMRGVAIHGVISEALTEKGVGNTFKYEFNDFDVMDSVPGYLPQDKFEKYLGMLLSEVPSPDASAKNFAEYFANEFKGVIEDCGFAPEFYWGSELYLSGEMDGVIRESLINTEKIRKIYKDISGSQKSEDWLPISIICPQCRKLATTEATEFDGENVSVYCREDKVKYTKGCGFKGKVSPFGGNCKLSWKVEWAAKWKVIGVDIEGGGKDHSTKGGARDVANHIAREVFNIEPPFDMPYEFFLVGGKKMSSSKGHGASAREIADLLPPHILRLALIGKDIKQQFNLEPEGDTVPVLFDTYDKYAESFFANVQDDYTRVLSLIHLPSERAKLVSHFLPRFSQVAFLVQMPHLSYLDEVARLKSGELSSEDKTEAELRAKYAKYWLLEYAPEDFRYEIQKELPESANNFSEEQKKALSEIVRYIVQNTGSLDGQVLHTALHEMRKSSGLEAKEFFSPIYQSILGKDSGPKAGWFLSVLDREFLMKRLKEVSI